MIIVPLLLLILVFSFYWSLTLKYASYGINHLFSPDWSKWRIEDKLMAVVMYSSTPLEQLLMRKRDSHTRRRRSRRTHIQTHVADTHTHRRASTQARLVFWGVYGDLSLFGHAHAHVHTRAHTQTHTHTHSHTHTLFFTHMHIFSFVRKIGWLKALGWCCDSKCLGYR